MGYKEYNGNIKKNINNKQYFDYIESKYGSNFRSGVSKLSIRNPYDENGLLKKEYMLTPQEHDAILFYVSMFSPKEAKSNVEHNDDFSKFDNKKIYALLDEEDRIMSSLVYTIIKTQSPKKEDLEQLLYNYKLASRCGEILLSRGEKPYIYQRTKIDAVVYLLTQHGLLSTENETKKPQGRK